MRTWIGKIGVAISAALVVAGCMDQGVIENDRASGDEVVEIDPDHEHFHRHGTVVLAETPEELERQVVDGTFLATSEDGFVDAMVVVTSENIGTIEYRVSGAERWQKAEMTLSEGKFHNAQIILDVPAHLVELRGLGDPTYVRVEMLPDVDHDHDHDLRPDEDSLGTEGEMQQLEQFLNEPGPWTLPDDVRQAGEEQSVRYDSASQCGGGMQPGASNLGQYIDEHFEGVRAIQGYNCRTIRGSNSLSMHATGRAIDIMLPLDGGQAANAYGDPIGNWLVENAEDIGVQLIIWDETIWNGSRGGTKHRSYGGVHPHHDHLHVEINRDGANQNTPFFADGMPAPDDVGQPDPTFDFDFDVNLVGLDDFYADGSSRGIPDALPGQELEAHIDITNTSDEVVRGVEIGYSVDDAYLAERDYGIYTDHPAYDRQSWQRNSADPAESTDNPGALGGEGRLAMHAFSPNETKRVVIKLEADKYSLPDLSVDHPQVRAWLTHADNVFEHSDGNWDDVAPLTELEGEQRQIRDRAKLDILSPDEWLFESLRDERDLEGWSTCSTGQHDAFIHNTNMGAMSMEISGDRACMSAPAWTRVDADAYDEMVISVRSHGGAHRQAIEWVSDHHLGAAQFPCNEVDRVSGSERYESSAAVSKQAFPGGANTAVLVYGEEPTSDASVAARLAAHHGGPLLLTRSDSLPDAVAQELARLNPNKVVLVGGEAVIGQQVEGAVESTGVDVQRVAGANRFATAAAVAREVGDGADEAILISAADSHLIDGAYAVGLAAQLDAPIFLAQGDHLPDATRDALSQMGIESTLVIGGEGAIASSVKEQLPSPRRLAGATRFETAAAVSAAFFESANSPEHLYIAGDDNMIDGVVASATGGLVMPSSSDALTPNVAALLGGQISSTTLVGGTGALSEQVERDACEAFGIEAAYEASDTVVFDSVGDGNFHDLVVPIGDTSQWRGMISHLRVMPHYDEAPSTTESRWYDTGRIFFQNSSTGETSSDIYEAVSQDKRVDIDVR